MSEFQYGLRNSGSSICRHLVAVKYDSIAPPVVGAVAVVVAGVEREKVERGIEMGAENEITGELGAGAGAGAAAKEKLGDPGAAVAAAELPVVCDETGTSSPSGNIRRYAASFTVGRGSSCFAWSSKNHSILPPLSLTPFDFE